MIERQPDFFTERVNYRVPNMAYDSLVQLGSPFRAEFGAPIALAIAGIFTATLATAAQTIANTLGLPFSFVDASHSKWGRALRITGNGTGAAVITAIGRDYLGQRVQEIMTLAATSAVAVLGVKAFKFLDTAILGSNANATDVLSVGFADKFGLPYASVAIMGSLMNGETATAHTLVVRSTTTPQTAVSTDPRGMLTLSTAANGTRTFAQLLELDTANMHGHAHFSG